MAQLAGGDPHQGDQVVGLPEAVDVALAEADAAAQDRAPGGRVVDRHRRPQDGVGGAEAAAATALEHLDPAGADPAQGRADEGAGGRGPHALNDDASAVGAVDEPLAEQLADRREAVAARPQRVDDLRQRRQGAARGRRRRRA